jgi:acyl carrier protein
MQELEDMRESLTAVLRDVFDDETLVLHPEMTAADVENWDSLTYIITAVERKFKVKFTTAEVTSLKNVGELASLIRRKRASHS